MNRIHIVLGSLVGIVLVASAVHWYKVNHQDSSSPPDYIKRLIDWAKKYHSVQPEDITHIQNADSMKGMFISLKNVPTCRSAKLLAYLYFSIYVERDGKALREFVKMMKEHYPDSYQWDNAFYWKQAEQLLWDTYDTLESSGDKNDNKHKHKHKQEQDKKSSTKKPNKLIKNFKAVVSKSKKRDLNRMSL